MKLFQKLYKNLLNKWRGDCMLIEFLQLRDMVMVFEWKQFYTFNGVSMTLENNNLRALMKKMQEISMKKS